MASTLYGSFLAGSLMSLLIPVGLLIAIAIWHGLAFARVPADPALTAAQATGATEEEGVTATPAHETPEPRA